MNWFLQFNSEVEKKFDSTLEPKQNKNSFSDVFHFIKNNGFSNFWFSSGMT